MADKTKRGGTTTDTVKEMSITFDQLMAEVERARPAYGYVNLTEDQKTFIIRCRNNGRPVSFPTMAKLWIRIGWPQVSSSSIQGWWYTLKTERGL